jgi:hypothetical protein
MAPGAAGRDPPGVRIFGFELIAERSREGSLPGWVKTEAKPALSPAAPVEHIAALRVWMCA